VSNPDTRTGAGSGDQGLLERFVEDIIVDDYGAPRAAEHGARQVAGHIAAGAAAALIGLVVVASLATTNVTTDQRQQTRSALIERISTTSADVQSRQERVDEAQGTIDALQLRVMAASSQQDAMSAQDMTRLTSLAGTTALAGPGVIVMVDDAPDARSGSLNRVLDRDLQDIVNVLWRSGASGVAVNDQRLTGSTAIRAAGEAILVNYQPLTRPYRVYAVGTSTSGTGDSGLQHLLDGLSSDYGLVTDVAVGDVALPAGELRGPRFASTEQQGAAGVATPSTSSGVGSQ
jgi:uncharacterized protein YlxW (UPF0749 family)